MAEVKMIEDGYCKIGKSNKIHYGQFIGGIFTTYCGIKPKNFKFDYSMFEKMTEEELDRICEKGTDEQWLTCKNCIRVENALYS